MNVHEMYTQLTPENKRKADALTDILLEWQERGESRDMTGDELIAALRSDVMELTETECAQLLEIMKARTETRYENHD